MRGSSWLLQVKGSILSLLGEMRFSRRSHASLLSRESERVPT